MKKFISTLCVMLLMICSMFTLVACNNDDENTLSLTQLRMAINTIFNDILAENIAKTNTLNIKNISATSTNSGQVETDNYIASYLSNLGNFSDIKLPDIILPLPDFENLPEIELPDITDIILPDINLETLRQQLETQRQQEVLRFFAVPYMFFNRSEDIKENEVYKDVLPEQESDCELYGINTIKGIWYEVKNQNGKDIICINIIGNSDPSQTYTNQKYLQTEKNIYLQIYIDFNFTNNDYSYTYYWKSEYDNAYPEHNGKTTYWHIMQTAVKENDVVVKHEYIQLVVYNDEKTTISAIDEDVYGYVISVFDENGTKYRDDYNDNETCAYLTLLLNKNIEIDFLRNQNLDNAIQLDDFLSTTNEFIINAFELLKN